jgi:aryl-alcohol dehydrogenase-like predicted oxidoreductase
MTTTDDKPVHASGTFAIGGDLPVHRLGFGAMRITGKGIWGDPPDREEAKRVLRRAVELGVDLIDTADSYGPYVSEDLIREALHPYPDELVIATKGGLTRQGPDEWTAVGRAPYLRQCVEMSLRRLGVERIDLYQLHRIDEHTPMEESLGELKAMQDEGKIRHIGLSEVDVPTLEAASRIVDVVSVQNLYNLVDRGSEGVLDWATRQGVAFIPWFPLKASRLSSTSGPLAEASRNHGATPSQLALAWLLRRSPVVLPIPGTGSVAHLEENLAAAGIELTDGEFTALG